MVERVTAVVRKLCPGRVSLLITPAWMYYSRPTTQATREPATAAASGAARPREPTTQWNGDYVSGPWRRSLGVFCYCFFVCVGMLLCFVCGCGGFLWVFFNMKAPWRNVNRSVSVVLCPQYKSCTASHHTHTHSLKSVPITDTHTLASQCCSFLNSVPRRGGLGVILGVSVGVNGGRLGG